MQAHTAMRCWPPEICRLEGTVDGVAAVEKDCVGHWRAAVNRRAVPDGERLRPEGSGRGVVAATRRRYRPGVRWTPVDKHVHALAREAHSGDDASFSRRGKAEQQR